VSEKLALEERLRDGAAVDRDERPRRTRGLLVDKPRDPLFARSALASDEDGGIDLRHAARQVDELPHLGALGDLPERLLDVAGHADQRPAVLVKLPLGGLQGLRDPLERDVEALLEAYRLQELQFLGAFVTPLLARAPEEVACSIALANAAVFEDVDLLAVAPAVVAAGEAANGPAGRLIGAAEVQEMLLRLVRGEDHHSLLRVESLASRLDAEKAFKGVEARARAAPVVAGVPLELGLHRLGHPPSVGEAELGEHDTGGREAEILDEVLSQEPHRDRVDKERSLPGEADRAPLRIEFEELFVRALGALCNPDRRPASTGALRRIERKTTSS